MGLARLAPASPAFFLLIPMTQETTLIGFVEDPTSCIEKLEREHLDRILQALAQAEHPESLRAFIWHLLRIVKVEPILETDHFQAWKPTEEMLAQLLEDVGKDGAPVVLALAQDQPTTKKLLDRLFRLCDELGTVEHVTPTDPWERVSRVPMVALLAEQQLDELIEAVAQGRQWKDPADILDPEGHHEIDLESIIALAQARMVKTNGSGEALNLVMFRLLSWADNETH